MRRSYCRSYTYLSEEVLSSPSFGAICCSSSSVRLGKGQGDGSSLGSSTAPGSSATRCSLSEDGIGGQPLFSLPLLVAPRWLSVSVVLVVLVVCWPSSPSVRGSTKKQKRHLRIALWQMKRHKKKRNVKGISEEII